MKSSRRVRLVSAPRVNAWQPQSSSGELMASVVEILHRTSPSFVYSVAMACGALISPVQSRSAPTTPLRLKI